MYETLCRQYVYFAVMYLYNPVLWGPCYGYLSILICLCPCRVAARRWYAGYLCVLFSSLWVGPLSQTWLRDPVGTSRATSPLNDVTRFFKNAGRHTYSCIQASHPCKSPQTLTPKHYPQPLPHPFPLDPQSPPPPNPNHG